MEQLNTALDTFAHESLFPLPTLLANSADLAVIASEEVIISLNVDGREEKFAGNLMEFSSSDSISVILHDRWDYASFAIADIEQILVSRQRNFDRSLAMQLGKGEHLLREYEILLSGGKTLRGATLPPHSDDTGVYLYPVEKGKSTFTCVFVPRHNIEEEVFGVPNISRREKVTRESLQKEIEQKRHALQKLLSECMVSNREELEHALSKQGEQPPMRLGELLLSDGAISEQQLLDALTYQRQHPNTPLGKILVDRHTVSSEQIQLALTRKLGIPYVNLEVFEIAPEVIFLLPEDVIKQYQALPLMQHGSRLVVAMENPLDRSIVDNLGFNTKLHIDPVLGSAALIKQHIKSFLADTEGDDNAFNLDEIDIDSEEADAEYESDADEVTETDNTVVKLANKIIIDAYRRGASDIHIEPYPRKQKAVVRFRKDGSLLNYYEIPASLRAPLISRYKIMAGLDISERRKPQDGKINFRRFGHLKIELRVATLPTVNDMEDVVMRILAEGKPRPLDGLGLSQHNLTIIKRMLEIPYGLFLVCGPTGSGKTTTLHSALGHLNTEDRKIWTAEDPVEITQRGLRQVQVNPKIGFTFASAMRAFLRADPDIIMVGEMRDMETAKMGIEASLTGHLVMSTLHTNSAPESLVRLLDMGLDPFNFSFSLVGVLAQRLTRCLCEKCKTSSVMSEQQLYDLSEEYNQPLLADLNKEQRQELIGTTIKRWRDEFADEHGNLLEYSAVGCDACEKLGYNGRVAIHEILESNDTIRRKIRDHVSVTEMQTAAIGTGMRTLKQDGVEKALLGVTDMMQVRKVCVH